MRQLKELFPERAEALRKERADNHVACEKHIMGRKKKYHQT